MSERDLESFRKETLDIRVEDDISPQRRQADRLARRLSARQVQMIAIGGTIGTGLFLGTGKSLATGGPASTLIADALGDGDQQRPKSEAKDTRVQVMARMTPAERKSLRRIALEQDTTVQALIEEAIRDLIRRHDGASAR